ncbi:hypothetical protein [Dysgonomonas capnocytophagoides]|uniref:hypothetical protein n=1 Tax=Dysgonomonas capnocytophagoides TaxID=45254 RepID=UPI00333E42D4
MQENVSVSKTVEVDSAGKRVLFWGITGSDKTYIYSLTSAEVLFIYNQLKLFLTDEGLLESHKDGAG